MSSTVNEPIAGIGNGGGGGGGGGGDASEATLQLINATLVVGNNQTDQVETLLGAGNVNTAAIKSSVDAVDVSVDAVNTSVGAGNVTLGQILTKLPTKEVDGSIPVSYESIGTKLREAFEDYVPGVRWVENKASGDLVVLDGNAVGASYLTISKSPLVAGNETSIESVTSFGMPFDSAMGFSMSQRTLGQDFSVEFIDTDPPLADVPELTISAIKQATTTLTITTTLPHNLAVGMSIGVYGVTDSRLNYPSLVVNAIVSPTQFTVFGGPAGNLPSVTVGPLASGFVYFRERLGRANQGISQIFENASVTNSSAYIRSNQGQAFPSGVLFTNHAMNVATSASVQLINGAFTYAFAPTTEFRYSLGADRAQWSDVGVDNVGPASSRLLRTQVIPDMSKQYKLRFRTTNNKGLTVPTAQIVSVSKSGTTTATIVFDRPHLLTTSDLFVAYGVNNQTNFPNLLTATAIASIVNATTITCIWGAAVTSTSYGGYVAKVQGGNLMSALGALTQVAASVTIANSVMTLGLNGSLTGALIGDYVELVGFRNLTDGSSLGVDGAWKIANIVSSTVTLIPLNITPPVTLGLTTCGGALIKRTDFRISYVRVFDYQRLRVEALNRPAGDQSASFPVVVNNTVNAGASAISNVTDVSSAAITTTATTSAFTPLTGNSYNVVIPVTAVSGTDPTLDVSIEESEDGGTNWIKVYDFPRITLTGMYRSPKLSYRGNRVRYVQTISGTSPSFTRSIQRQQTTDTIPELRQLIDRTINLNTLNSVTPSILAQNCHSVSLTVVQGAGATVAPQVQLQGSVDNGLTWFFLGSPLVGLVSAAVDLTLPVVNAQLYRAIITTAGVGATLSYVAIRAFV